MPALRAFSVPLSPSPPRYAVTEEKFHIHHPLIWIFFFTGLHNYLQKLRHQGSCPLLPSVLLQILAVTNSLLLHVDSWPVNDVELELLQ